MTQTEQPEAFNPVGRQPLWLNPEHFELTLKAGIAVIRLKRPERKNPLTFDSYAELRDWFRALAYDDAIQVVVWASNEGNFCSGGDVHDIIGPLTRMDMSGLMRFTRMTGDLVKAMFHSWFSCVLVIMWAKLGPWAKRSAKAKASASSAAGSCKALKKPQAWPSSADMARPV
jgi:hypothetical protein